MNNFINIFTDRNSGTFLEIYGGMYPVESVKMMEIIASRVERSLQYQDLLRRRLKETKPTVIDAISQSVAHTAIVLDVAAIIAPTEGGYTAKMIAKYRPKSPIAAVTFDERVCRKPALVWGI